ncbi:MAG: hypothetical protein ACRDLT_08880 [Solirubrobacteraceae bacterium]
MYSESGFCDPDKPIGKFTKTELHDFLYREPTRMKIAGVNMTYLGLVGRIQRPMLSKEINIAEVCAMQISEPRRGSSSPIATHAAQPHTRSSSGWLTSGWAT